MDVSEADERCWRGHGDNAEHAERVMRFVRPSTLERVRWRLASGITHRAADTIPAGAGLLARLHRYGPFHNRYRVPQRLDRVSSEDVGLIGLLVPL